MSMQLQEIHHEPIRIMIADDDKMICKAMKNYFDQSQDFQVVGVVNDGLRLIERLNEWKPDVLLLDIVMPHKDGNDVLDELQVVEHHDVSIFVLSAAGTEQTTRRALELNVTYFFVKPFPMELLSNRIRTLYQRPASRQVPIKPKDEDRIVRWGDQDQDRPVKHQPELSLQQQAAALLHEVGVPPHLSGYRYLLDAICMTVDKAGLTGGMTKVLYPTIAQKHNSTGVRVERSVRHAVEVAFSRCKVETLEKLFGYTVSAVKGKPTNGEFIAMMADRIRLHPGDSSAE